jgi:hypothetical protein
MGRPAARLLLLLLGLAASVILVPGAVSIWVDSSGRTWLGEEDSPPVPDAARVSPEELARRWRGSLIGDRVTGSTDGSTDEDRLSRELRAAREDLARGEIRSGIRRLHHLQRLYPARPEVSWALAVAERERGRLDSALAALENLLAVAAPIGETWQRAAERLHREIREEQALAEQGGVYAIRELATSNFRIRYDHRFAGRGYGERVAELLEEARRRVVSSLGRGLPRALDVYLYTRGGYLDAYRHKFGFATVGFYDGAIHVVSARHPRRDLLALLVHEYVHAVFRESLGSDRPFFLNEGIADHEEERVRGRATLARGDWRRLLDAERAGEWIPLSGLVRGFSHLSGTAAALAYLEARGAIALIEEAHPGAVAGFLARTASGAPWQEALRLETGHGPEALDAALRASVRARFPDDPLAASDAAGLRVD